MKKLYTIALGFTASLLMVSCVKHELLDFHVDKPISFENQEKIDSYKALKTYIDRSSNPDFKFGAAVSLSDYVNKGVMYRLVNNNFDEIVLGYAMKHGAVVKADGKLDLDNVKELLKTAHDAGISVYGHTLCWHANQNATYLNKLIAPTIIPSTGGPSLGPNLISNGDFESGNGAGWGGWGNSSTRGITASGQGYNGTGLGYFMTNPSKVNSWQAQTAYDFSTALEKGATYKLSFYVKGSAAGSASAALQETKTYGADDFGAFDVTTDWKLVELEKVVTADDRTRFLFSFGAYEGTIYIDNISLAKFDPNGGVMTGNQIVANFESDNLGKTYTMTNGGSATVVDDPKGVSGKVLNVKSNQSHPKFEVTLPLGVTLGNCENLTMDFYATGSTGLYGTGMKMSINGGSLVNYGSPASYGCPDGDWGRGKIVLPIANMGLSSDQKKLNSFTIEVGSGTGSGNYYIDNVALAWKTTGDLIVEKTPAEKKTIITGALTNFISAMVDTCKNYVKAWDVVNEPISDGNSGRPYNLKTLAEVTGTVPSDFFFWQDYLGEDYAVEAFKIARQHANAGDLLFINDYNLEYSLDKCNKLIDYVAYIESKGAKVDGIGTQMHISTNSNKDKIVEMFKLLAATKKKIKVSELDMGINGKKTAQATEEDYIAQAELYKFVIEKYFELIPASQRYGITIWAPTDSPESSSWRKGEPIGLWTEGFVRKPAYVGVAEALQGK
ncbi:endo-1,4-beta-xylanase [Pelobium manganitolerans]|uniref:endo-1,4-beta-xylanase n=1 Tax=Pelobium manganitolerans TaxID=1842495 RepID=UPI003FA3A6AE